MKNTKKYYQIENLVWGVWEVASIEFYDANFAKQEL